MGIMLRQVFQMHPVFPVFSGLFFPAERFPGFLDFLPDLIAAMRIFFSAAPEFHICFLPCAVTYCPHSKNISVCKLDGTDLSPFLDTLLYCCSVCCKFLHGNMQHEIFLLKGDISSASAGNSLPYSLHLIHFHCSPVHTFSVISL